MLMTRKEGHRWAMQETWEGFKEELDDEAEILPASERDADPETEPKEEKTVYPKDWTASKPTSPSGILSCS